MTREEAINKLRDMITEIRAICDESKHMSEDDRQDMETFDMAIKALEQEPSEDCISRQAVKDMLDARGVKAVMTFEHFKELLDKLPPVTPQPFINKPCVSEGVCREDKIQVLDKIRAEIEGMYRVILIGTPEDDWAVRWNDCLDEVLQIIDKYKAESEESD